MVEAVVVVGHYGKILYINTGESAAIPDSRTLWEIIWENRDKISGVAHSHPGRGVPGPSSTDLSTFKAVDNALGKPLLWVITTENEVVACHKNWDYRAIQHHYADETQPEWLTVLREVSYRKGGEQ